MMQLRQPKPLCVGCKRHPADIPGMVEAARDYFGAHHAPGRNSVDDFARADGTYNRLNGHFLCDRCYVASGCPSAPGGWVAP